MNHVDKYYWILCHPSLIACTIDLSPVIVNPENNTVEEDPKLNTKFQWWGGDVL